MKLKNWEIRLGISMIIMLSVVFVTIYFLSSLTKTIKILMVFIAVLVAIIGIERLLYDKFPDEK